MKLQQRVVELVIEDGAPVFDVRIPPKAPGVPAEILEVHCRAERGKVIAKKQAVKLVTCLVMLVDPDLPEEHRRFGLLLPGGHIPDGLAQESRHIGTYLHPANGVPVSVFEFPWTDLAAEEVAAADGPDVLAAIEVARDAQEAES